MFDHRNHRTFGQHHREFICTTMSVDRTIEELSGTLNQLGILVEHINLQIGGITSRINRTLDNFDNSVAGIATDAGAMTGQLGTTIAQVRLCIDVCNPSKEV